MEYSDTLMCRASIALPTCHEYAFEGVLIGYIS